VMISRGATAQVPPDFSREFDRIDRQTRRATQQLHCMVEIGNLVKKGVVAASDSAGAYLMCPELGGRFVGVFAQVDSSWKRFVKFAAFDPMLGERIATPLDTAEALVVMMSQSRVVYAMKDDAEFLPPIALRGDSAIHVWLIPESILPLPLPQVGGEHHFLVSADGRKILRADSVPPKHAIPRPPGSSYAWTVETGTDSVPSFSEMLFGNMLSRAGQSITFLMKTRVAQLVGDFDHAVWVFMPRKP
jgi:hypothetical protein